MLFTLDEIKREREFYRARGLPCPKDILPNTGEVEEEKANADAHAESDYHRTDEQVITVSKTKVYKVKLLNRDLKLMCQIDRLTYAWSAQTRV